MSKKLGTSKQFQATCSRLARLPCACNLLHMIITKPDSRPLLGMLWMLLTGFCFVAVTALVKYLGDDLPAAQQAFLRYLLGLVFLIPMWPALRAARTLAAGDNRLRGAWLSFMHWALLLWFYAMTQNPLGRSHCDETTSRPSMSRWARGVCFWAKNWRCGASWPFLVAFPWARLFFFFFFFFLSSCVPACARCRAGISP